MQEIVGQDSHEQPGFVGGEATATRLVPAQRVVPLFDPVLKVASSIVHHDHLHTRLLGIGNNEPDPPEEFPIVMFDLRNNYALAAI